MTKQVENVEETVSENPVKDYSFVTVDVKALYFGLRADLVAALENGDEATILAIREAIVSVKDLTGYLVTKTFDTTVDFIHTKEGEDFLPNVTRIYQPRGRAAGEKKVLDPFA